MDSRPSVCVIKYVIDNGLGSLQLLSYSDCKIKRLKTLGDPDVASTLGVALMTPTAENNTEDITVS